LNQDEPASRSAVTAWPALVGAAARAWAVGIAIAAVLALAWYASGTLLLIFAGLLVAVVLDSAAGLIERFLPVSRWLALTLTCLVLTLAFGGGLLWGGYILVDQADVVIDTVGKQINAIADELAKAGMTAPTSPDRSGLGILRSLLPDPHTLVSNASSWFTTTFGILGNIALIVFIGAFAAANPELYRNGALLLVPPGKRARVGEVLDEVARVLHGWLIGQMLSMLFIGVLTTLLLLWLGLPSALVLGVFAGLMNFVPYAGPVITAVPIALVAMTMDNTTLALALGGFTLIQQFENNIFSPLVQRRVSDIPPLLLLIGLMLSGSFFGAAGVALAAPLTAAIRILVLRLYVEDVLERPHARG
jgi:predicted PurR-regulated permease PerM